MNLAQFLAHFDRISDAPDAIPRLRRFILDLAVRGKLVEQDGRDEPVSELLKRIVAEKIRRGRTERVKRAEPTPVEDESFPLPMGWTWASLADLVAVLNGRAYSQNELLNAGTPVLRVGNLFTSKHWYYSNLELEEDKYCSDGDLIFAWSASFGPFIWHGPKVIYHYHIWKLQLHSEHDIDKNYLYRFLLHKTEEIKESGHGVSMIHMTKEKMEKVQVGLPPLAEQQRIVAKVDELMALCDRLEAAQAERESRRDRLAASSLNRLNNGADPDAFHDHARFYFNHLPRLTTRLEHIQQLRQTILNLAILGKLVPQDLNDEPASELLKQIQAEKVRLVNEGTIKRLQPVLPIDAEEISFAVPNGWEWVRLSDLLLGDTQNGYSKKPDDALNGIPILRISAGTVRKDRVVAEEEHKLIGGVSAAQQEQYRLQPGDLLACRFNGNRSFVGRLTIYLDYLGLRPIYPDKLIRLRLFSQFALPKLVRCFAESSVVRKDIESYCATTVGNWGISASNLKEIKIPLPPLAEQYRIVAKVDELMALCDRLEAQLTTTQTESRRLLDAVLHEALAPT